MKEREISNASTGSQGEAQTGNKLPHPRAFAKRGGTAGDGDREGLGWPPSELALLFVLPEHQSTTIPPFLRKAKGPKARREENNRKARDIKRGYRLTRGGSNREQASQTPRLRKKGGTAGDGDREGLGWPPWELVLLFVLPEHQSTTIPPLLRKARGKRKKGRKQHQRNKDPKKREKLNSTPSKMSANQKEIKQGTQSKKRPTSSHPPTCIHHNTLSSFTT
jgi:hypothetical protein